MLVRLAATPATPSSSPSTGGPITDDEPSWLAQQLSEWFSWSDTVAGLVGGVVQILLIFLAVFLIGRVLRRLIRRVGRNLTDGKGIDATLSKRKAARRGVAPAVPSRSSQRVDAIVGVSQSLVSAVLWTIAVVVVLATVGVNVGPLLASAGILGVAIGFGAQDVVGDFLNGFFMLVEDQYAVGDVIDAGEATGVVEYIGLRTTRLRDVSGTLWHVPNGEIRRVGNMSQEWARAMLDVGVGYDADLPAAIDVIKTTAVGLWESDESDWSSMILEEPAVWGVEELGDSSIAIRLVVKTRPGDQWTVARELRLRLKAALASAEIEIPFPQRTVWLRTDATGIDTPRFGVLPLEQDQQGELRPAAVAEGDGGASATDAARAAEEESQRSDVDPSEEYNEQEVRRAAAEQESQDADED